MTMVIGDDGVPRFHRSRLRKFHDGIRNDFLRRLVPFKGNFYWEIQVGPFVLQWRFSDEITQPPSERPHMLRGLGKVWKVSIGRFLMWNDPIWRSF